jgi:Family of unknown function (DUF6459)
MVGVVLAVQSAPTLDPPYEDAVDPPTGMDLLPIDWSPSPPVPTRPPAPVDAASRPPASVRPVPAPRPARASPPAATEPGLVTARQAMQRYVAMCVEVLNGYRPSAHLRPITDQQRFGEIADQLVRRAVRVRISPAQAARQGKLVRVRRMLLSEPLAGLAEAAVVLEQGTACWAMAIRLERGTKADRSTGPWRCTVLQVV